MTNKHYRPYESHSGALMIEPIHFEGRCARCARLNTGAHSELQLETGKAQWYPLLHECCFPNPCPEFVPASVRNLAHLFRCYGITVGSRNEEGLFFECDGHAVSRDAIVDLAAQNYMSARAVSKLLTRLEGDPQDFGKLAARPFVT